VISRFKAYNIVLLCSPQKREGDCDTLKSVTDLKKFYEKFGFKKTGELLPTMIRKAEMK
jgi:predicted GNAT family N-acyltransferase